MTGTVAKIPKQAPDFRLETVEAETLLYHPTRTQTLYLNETASLIWRLCDGTRSTEEITVLLRDAFPDAGDDIGAQVESTVAELARQAAVTFV